MGETILSRNSIIAVYRRIRRLSGNLPIPSSRFPAEDWLLSENRLLPVADGQQLPTIVSASDRRCPEADASGTYPSAPWLPTGAWFWKDYDRPRLLWLVAEVHCLYWVADRQPYAREWNPEAAAFCGGDLRLSKVHPRASASKVPRHTERRGQSRRFQDFPEGACRRGGDTGALFAMELHEENFRVFFR